MLGCILFYLFFNLQLLLYWKELILFVFKEVNYKGLPYIMKESCFTFLFHSPNLEN